jgi:hypothetical protein
VVLDPFAGSNATGEAAESLGRRWDALECNRDYLISSAFRFMADWPDDDVASFVSATPKRCRRAAVGHAGAEGVVLNSQSTKSRG